MALSERTKVILPASVVAAAAVSGFFFNLAWNYSMEKNFTAQMSELKLEMRERFIKLETLIDDDKKSNGLANR